MTPLILAALIAVPTLAVLGVGFWWLGRRRIRPVQTFEEHTLAAMDLIHDAVFTGEDDEPAEDVVAAFERGKKGVTKRPEFQQLHRTYSCIHATVSGPILGPPELPCGCDMQEET